MANYTLFMVAILPTGPVNTLIVRSWERSYTGDAQFEEADVMEKSFSYVYLQDPACDIGILTEAVENHSLWYTITSGQPVPLLHFQHI